jgi:hypothetical protein
VDALFGPIVRGAAATLGKPVDRHGAAILDALRAPSGGAFLVRCGLLYRRGQDVWAGCASRLAEVRECHDGPLGGHFGRTKTVSLVRRLAFWAGQDVDVAEYVRKCQSCQVMA